MTGCAPLPVVAVTLPIETRSELNRRDGWAARHRRSKAAHLTIFDALSLLAEPPSTATHNVLVRMTRAGGKSLDNDNREGALKAVRDTVARWLQLPSDNHPHVTWRTAEREASELAVTVEVFALERGRPASQILASLRELARGREDLSPLVDELSAALFSAGVEGIYP